MDTQGLISRVLNHLTSTVDDDDDLNCKQDQSNRNSSSNNTDTNTTDNNDNNNNATSCNNTEINRNTNVNTTNNNINDNATNARNTNTSCDETETNRNTNIDTSANNNNNTNPVVVLPGSLSANQTGCCRGNSDASSGDGRPSSTRLNAFLRGYQYEIVAYEPLLGSGAFGYVYAVKSLNSEVKDPGDTYVAKVIVHQPNLQQPMYLHHLRQIAREMYILKLTAGHPNIVHLKAVLIDRLQTPTPALKTSTSKTSTSKTSEEEAKIPAMLVMIFERVDTDLMHILRSNQTLTDKHIKRFMYQLLFAVKYLHSIGVMHRDIKPANILISENCDLQLCDFGMCRFQMSNNDSTGTNTNANANSNNNTPKTKKRTYTHHVVTRWYRPPEIPLLTQQQSTAIDMFSIGCVFAECLTALKESQIAGPNRRPLFPSSTSFPVSYENCWDQESERDHLNLIFSLLGTPTVSDLSSIDVADSRRHVQSLKYRSPTPLEHKFPYAKRQALDLLEHLLLFNPANRWTANEALEHPYFDEVREQNKFQLIAKQSNWSNSDANRVYKQGQQMELEWSEMDEAQLISFITTTASSIHLHHAKET